MTWMWSQDETDFLKELRSKGHSARKIAILLKQRFTTRRYTRNSVIGKLHRLGLCLHISAQDHSLRIREGKKENSKSKPKFKSYPLPEPEPTPDTAIFFYDLDTHHCRYPYGEGNEIVYCGEDRTMGSSYCVDHHIKCYGGV